MIINFFYNVYIICLKCFIYKSLFPLNDSIFNHKMKHLQGTNISEILINIAIALEYF